MTFEVKRNKLEKESGTDMFASLMERLQSDGVKVQTVVGRRMEGSEDESVNYHRYLKNLETMEAEEAAADTWTGRIARRFGYPLLFFGEEGTDEKV